MRRSWTRRSCRPLRRECCPNRRSRALRPDSRSKARGGEELQVTVGRSARAREVARAAGVPLSHVRLAAGKAVAVEAREGTFRANAAICRTRLARLGAVARAVAAHRAR